MSSFTKPLSITQVSVTPRVWRLDKGFRYCVGVEDSDHYFNVKKGFIYDGGSIPRFAWWVDSPIGDGAQAYCLHDIMYTSHIVSRKEADEIFYEALKVLGLNWFRRSAIYSAVRMFGGSAWAGKSKEDIAAALRFIKEVKPVEESGLI